LLNESYLWRLNANLLFTWGLGKEAIPVIDFMMERYPDSGAQVLLAEAHILTGNYEAAIELYSKFLERYPNNTIAQSRLAWLRSR
jgi:tetratricopeptide (TPR) repeat protein